jgi:hypothetical protein
MATAEQRFVVLHHALADGEHWDLMLERGEVLVTWQLDAAPGEVATGPARARRIGDHRKAYLDYEGPVSRNRGEVRRVDEGTWRLEQAAADEWRIHLRGRVLRGAFVLRCAEPAVNVWRLELC